MTQPSGRRLTAIVFTDIVGYSAVVHQDEALGRRLLDRQREVVRRLLARYGGREVETAGDSFLLEFESALAAVQTVIAVQQELAQATEPRVTLRASVHLGDVEHRGREVYGDGVNIAARLLPHSPEGGLALSAAVNAVIRQRLNLPLRSIGEPPLKNITTPVEIFALDPAALRALPAAAEPQGSIAMPDPNRRLRGPHGLLFAALAQALAGLFDLFLGFGLIVLPLYAVDTRNPEAHLSSLYMGVLANLVGVAMIGACYGLVRTHSWGRSASLVLNFLNIPLAISLQTIFWNLAQEHAAHRAFPLWVQLSGSMLSLIVMSFLLNPRVSAQFARYDGKA